MSPPPSFRFALAVHSGFAFAEEENGTGIHARPTLSMPPAVIPAADDEVPSDLLKTISQAVTDLCAPASSESDEILEVLPSDLLEDEADAKADAEVSTVASGGSKTDVEAEEHATLAALASDLACSMPTLAPASESEGEGDATEHLSSDDLMDEVAEGHDGGAEDVKADEPATNDDAAADEGMVAQASLPPPSPEPLAMFSRGSSWEAPESVIAPPAPRFRRATVAGAAGAFLAGLMLVSAIVDGGADSTVSGAARVGTDVAAAIDLDNANAMGAANVSAPSQPFGPAAADTTSTTSERASSPSPSPWPTPSPSHTPSPPPSRVLSLADGDRALGAGDFDGAEEAYQSMLVRGGLDYEALTGLGRIAAARHRTTDAMAFFERSLARQPGYLPARLGLADVLWDAGRKDAAAGHYREIRARFANELYPTRVVERTR